MVEQPAAAAATLRAQAEGLTEVVATFRVRSEEVGRHVLVVEDEDAQGRGLALPAPAYA
jgi:methyl-accepting chemotaxis protein